MIFFAINEEVERQEAELSAADPGNRLPLMVALAWQLRQRDSERARSLCQQARDLPGSADLPANSAQALRMRIQLIDAEMQWLSNKFDHARTQALAALQGFTELGHALGRADAHWLLSWIAWEQGDLSSMARSLNAMEAASNGHDSVRQIIAQANLARLEAFSDPGAARARWQAFWEQAGLDPGELHPAAHCWVEDMYWVIAHQTSDYVNDIQHLSQTYSLALATGQIRRALVAAANIGEAFNNLNDYHTALDWMQRSLDLAREKNWPINIAIALRQTAETLRHLQRLDAAHDLLQEAIPLLLPESGSYANTLLCLGDVELAQGRHDQALSTFQLLEQRASALNKVALVCKARRGQAQAWLGLDQPQAALTAIQAALSGAPANADDQITLLRVKADIHARYNLPGPAHMVEATPAMHYLQQALKLAQGVENLTIPGSLLESLAQEHAKLGHYQQAWELGQQASQVRETSSHREAHNRAHAMQVSHQTERAQAEDAHRRELASEAKRAEILQQTSETLEHLGAIGQEITAHLDAQHVFDALHHHLYHLFDVTTFAIYLMQADGQSLHRVFCLDGDELLPPCSIRLDDATLVVARCARERREVLVNHDPELGPSPYWIHGTQTTVSALFAPLLLADKVLGVMTIQSTRQNAYTWGAREQMISRTLCAYTAIALSNAEAHGKLAEAHANLAQAHDNLAQAHRQLLETQQQMILQGKMAGLGSLTAGVAHEINNPTNFVHVAAQNQRVDIAEFEQYVAKLIDADDAPEIVQGFAGRFAKLSGNVNTMLNGTGRIKGIVKDLRAFTRLDEADKKAVRMSECLTSTLNLVRTSWSEKVEFITEFDDDPAIECWPALLNQVFMNLLVNACQSIEEKFQHATNRPDLPGEHGKLWLRLFLQDGLLVIVFEDNGIGMSQQTQARIMEPFYTTKATGTGTGLGLSIAFGIVQKHGGNLSFTSMPGVGACFTIQLPLVSTSAEALPVQ